ncbi:MAG: hypothetical protein FWH50_01445, partial [Coriobacteriia bacterium]|nr:hypothetical protein [Coriobacteriia bacterium]
APPAGSPQEQQYAPQPVLQYAPQAPAPVPPPKKKSKLPIIIVVLVLVTALGIGGGVAIYSINKANRYEAVVVTYEEAGSTLQHASTRRDYEDAKELFQTAILGFEEFGDYKDALHLISVCDSKIQECDQNIDYIDANALFDDGEYAAAQRAFEALGYFRDSVAMAELCAKYLRFEDAQAVFDSGDFNEALNLFNDLVNEDFFEAEEWVPKTRYAIADAYSAAGEHYEAWKIFTALGDYSDSAYRASAQISSYPGTGELYHNGGYVSSAVHLVFDGANLTEVRYIKIYSDGNLVSTVFINIYSSTTIYLPSGTYTIKVAFGDNWFGEEVMFGDEGFYATMTFDGGSTSTYFAYNYIYTLTMMVSEDDANVGAEQTNRNDF